jgi:hypothetical protein
VVDPPGSRSMPAEGCFFVRQGVGTGRQGFFCLPRKDDAASSILARLAAFPTLAPNARRLVNPIFTLELTWTAYGGSTLKPRCCGTR